MDAITDSMFELGEGEYRYGVAEGWGKLPDGWVLGDVAAIAVDDKDRVYVFSRGDHPMVVFDREGNFLNSWGYGMFQRPHGLHYARDGYLYCTDDVGHNVRKCTLDGKVVLELGTPGVSSPFMSGKPFNRCTHTALAPNGDIYVCDGYCNAAVHKYSPDGKYLFSWGKSGCGEGEFTIPHNIICDDAGMVYVADRENHRVQVFDGNGKYQGRWDNLHRPSALVMSAGGRCPLCYVGELGPYGQVNLGHPNLGPRVSVVTMEGKVLARVGLEEGAAGDGPGQFTGIHAIAVDSRGDLYIGEVASVAWPSLFPDRPPPAKLRTLQKLVKLPA